MTLYVVEESRDESAPRRFDLRGFVMLTVGLVLVVLGVQTSGQSGWGSPLVVVSVLAGLAAIALLLMLEPRVRTPLIEFALFRNRVFMGTLLIHFSWNWVWSVFMFLLTLYLQHVRDLSPLQTGVLYLGFALPFVIGSSVAGKVGARVGERMQILGGMSLGVLGSLIFALLAEQASYALIVLGFVALGVGGALSYNAATSLGMASVPDAKSGEASGIQNTVLQLGAVFGLAAGTAVFKAIENQRVLASLERAGARLSQGDRGELAGLLSGSDAAQQRLGTLAAAVDGGRIIAADKEPQNWLSHGRTYGEQRFSPLAKITTANVGQLGLAWSHDIASRTARGVEATPIVVDGVMYTTGAWSHVLALDARTGKLLWEFDPQISGAYGAKGCCDVVNRGVAVWAGKVYVGAFDGRLIALDAKTGKKVWETLTVDQSQDYTISGAPRVVKGKVIIGNGGADFGVRGYVSAYDAETGTMAWRFYTVPGNPKDGFESKTVEMIAKTWHGEWWRHGGGGTVWDSMAYDPDLDLL